ncbi:hypothetical protein [Stenotrophomonas geniculata]|uniref:hypothetical protein n=1 Tax=Stenotrophomonas geniculata TaxID=86188 RepID=UPI003BF81296
MIIGLTPLFDISVEAVIARGLANQERIVLRANMETYTANIGLMLGYRQKDEALIPLRDRMYWLGAGTVKAGSIINVYTGSGEQTAFDNGNGTSTYNLFWGLQFVAFDVPQVEPVLFRLGEATVGARPLLGPNIPGPQLRLGPG